MISNPRRYELKKSQKEEMSAVSLEEKKNRVMIHSYKDLSLRKKYRKMAIRYMLFFLVVFAIGIICMFLFHFNRFAVGVTSLFGFVLCVNLVDLCFLNNATKKLDRYVCNLSISELERIENGTRYFYDKYRLMFLEKEMIFSASSFVAAFEYSAIASIKEQGDLVELFGSDGHNLGFIPSTGWNVTENPPQKKKTINIKNI